MQRVIFYVDGFNLYYGMRSKSWKRYYWLDIARLAERLLRPYQSLVFARYFTARIHPDGLRNADRKERQDAYLEALSVSPNTHIHYGRFLKKERSCNKCGESWTTYEEKMTDVNISVELLDDARFDRFDTAIIVSADSDLVGPVKNVRARHPEKRVVIAFPPDRNSVDLRKAANASFNIGRDALRDSQLPDIVANPNGYQLSRPDSWA